jgi:glycosyltransferase involved in cell wall biosynthesis
MVSVVLTSYNACAFLPEAIESVLRQTYSQYELIIVDDGSADGSLECARRYEGPGVQVVSHRNQGPGSALNTCLKLAAGEYVALLDGDDAWHPEKLNAHVESFREHAEADLTFTWSDWIDGDSRPVGLGSKRCEGAFTLDDLMADFVIGNTSSVAIRRSALEEIAYCDASLFRYYDADLFFRIAQRGSSKVRVIPRALTYYRRHPGQMSADFEAMRQEWNRLAEKHRTQASPMALARGRSNMARYFAYLAYENRDPSRASAILRDSIRDDAGLFATDIRNWKLCALIGSALVLPASWHTRLESVAKRLT